MDSARQSHPCFNPDAAGSCARVHLPVAPKCNVLCNYCNRKYDCQNESRPGVTSAILSPAQAIAYLDEVMGKMPEISVVGIAGPGDPMANPAETLGTIRRIRERHPRLLVCLSSNGLGLPAHLDEIAELGITHTTVTMNAVDLAVGQQFYRWVRDGKVLYRGIGAAELMLERQMQSIRGLKERGITVKVNTIVTPGVNDSHVEDIARVAAGLGVDLLNLIPLYPTGDTPFGHLPEPSPKTMEELRARAQQYLPQMRHCRRCRADAVGLLACDRSREMAPRLIAHAQSRPELSAGRPHVAVATREGLLVNHHLGEASSFQVWGRSPEGYVLIGSRPAPPPGGGGKRWFALAEVLKDCRAVLVSGIGETPRIILEEAGVSPVVMDGLIQQGLAAAYEGINPSIFGKRQAKSCIRGCSGNSGIGCG
ncbi:MAG: radical SAM protein [Deltaproteobacteria bacterium]|nr:radical SAM protein [Deltaproteobacteria bacterium]